VLAGSLGSNALPLVLAGSLGPCSLQVDRTESEAALASMQAGPAASDQIDTAGLGKEPNKKTARRRSFLRCADD
jgi:hypothetical protein